MKLINSKEKKNKKESVKYKGDFNIFYLNMDGKIIPPVYIDGVIDNTNESYDDIMDWLISQHYKYKVPQGNLGNY